MSTIQGTSGVSGVQLDNANWHPIAYNVRLIIPAAATPGTTFVMVEDVTITRKKHEDGSSTSGQEFSIHAGESLETITAVSGCEILERDVEGGRMHMKIDATKDASTTFRLLIAGKYRDDMKGIYKSKFREEGASQGSEGQTPVYRTLISTHFEPIAARHFFCCVDEPAVRCDFTISVALVDLEEHKDFVVVSGGQQEGAIKTTNWKALTHGLPSNPLPATFDGLDVNDTTAFREWSFATVPQISSYLTVVLIGPMDFAEVAVASKAHGSIPMRYYIPKGTDKTKIQFALDVGKVAFEYFENFFAPTPYPLKKIDFAAIPQFSIGGEESFGLIMTYTGCLLDPDTTSVRVKSRIASLVAHELSHNWFGDIVSIKFWSGLYLKEGFASYFGYDGANAKYPEWEPMDDGLQGVLDALETDGFLGTHPLEQEILDEGRIVESFDAISYDKGQGLVFMLAAFLGAKRFREAIAFYIAKFRGTSTTTIQLWEALEEATGEKIAAVMDDYVTKPGHPIVTANILMGNMALTQRRYSTIAASKLFFAPADPAGWNVPVTIWRFAKSDCRLLGTESVILPPTGEVLVKVTDTPDDEIILINAEHAGFFRSNYDAATWERLFAPADRFHSLPVAVRRGIIDDIFALRKSGDVTVSTVKALIAAMKSSSQRLPLSILTVYAGHVGVFLDTLPEVTPDLVRDCYQPFLFWADESKVSALSLSGKEAAAVSQIRPLAQRQVLKAAERLVLGDDKSKTFADVSVDPTDPNYEFWKLASTTYKVACDIGPKLSTASSEEVDPNMAPVYSFAYVRYGPTSHYDDIWQQFLQHSEEISFVRVAFAGLGQTRDTERFTSLVNAAIEAKEIHQQYGDWVFFHACHNHSCASGIVWPLFIAHFPKIKKNWGGGQFAIQSIVENVSETIAADDEGVAEEWHAFFETNQLPNARLAIVRGEERIVLRRLLKQRSA